MAHPRVQHTARERAADRRRLVDIAARLQDLELERSLSAGKELLETEQDLLQDRLNAYIYPVLSLPPEVVSEIFIRFLPVYQRRAPDKGLYSPVVLTHICRLWREIALSTPRLWCTFKIILHAVNLSSKENHDANLVGVEEWLQRSGSCPLSVELEYFRQDPPLILQTILAHKNRWEHLKLAASVSKLPTIVGPFPLLRTLTVTMWVGDSESDDHRPTAFRDAPLLQRRVAIAQCYSEGRFRDMLPWSQLTVLVIQSIEVNESMGILALTPRLVHCDLTLWSVAEGDAPSHVSLDQLKTLKLRRSKFNAYSTMLSVLALQVPALRRLHIDEMYLMPDRVVALRALLMRWNCTPQEIRIARPQQPIHAYSEALPSILISSTNRPRVTIRFLDPQPATIVGLEAANHCIP
ncbi:hypothetical protein C8R46DRAFT_1075999, partial [Mycena filopes]